MLLFIACEDKKNIDNLSDSKFSLFVSGNKNCNEGVFKIDSLLFKQSFSTNHEGILFLEKANYLICLEKYVEASVYFKKALPLFIKANNKKYIGFTKNQLGNVNIYLENNKEALKNITEAITIFKGLKDKKNEAVALDALAHLKLEQKEYFSSIQLLNEIIEIKHELLDTINLSKTYNNLAEVYDGMSDKINAQIYFEKAADYVVKLETLNSTPIRNLAFLYYDLNNKKEALRLFYKALEIEKKTKNLVRQKLIYNALIRIKEDTIKNITIRDSITIVLKEQEAVQKIESIKAKYELISKKRELIIEKKSNAKDLVIKVSLMGLLFFASLFFYFKIKNTLLRSNQEKLILEQKVLRSQMNPHFIFNALGSIQKSMLENDPLESASSLSKFSKLIRKNFELVNKSLISLSEEIAIIYSYIEVQRQRFNNSFSFKINVSDNMEKDLIQIPPFLVQPFIENAIEHGLRPLDTLGYLEINIFKKDAFICIEILDNGIGLSNQIKKTDREHSTEIFLKRLKIRGLGEEKYFSIKNREKKGAIVTILIQPIYA